MKISLIGSGWLAQPLALQLQVDGHEVIMTTTQRKKISDLNATGLKALQYELGDQLSDPNQLFDTDILIIAITCKDIEAFDVFMDQLSEQACKHLIFISSTSVYQNDGSLHDENSKRLNRDTPLLTIEQLIQQHPKATIIRFAGLVGPNRHPGQFFKQGKAISHPESAINLIHLDDCIGIIGTIIKQGAWNEVFNGCADNHPTKGEYYQHMAKQAGVLIPPLGTATSGSNKIIDNNKVKKNLNYQFKYPDVFKMM